MAACTSAHARVHTVKTRTLPSDASAELAAAQCCRGCSTGRTAALAVAVAHHFSMQGIKTDSISSKPSNSKKKTSWESFVKKH